MTVLYIELVSFEDTAIFTIPIAYHRFLLPYTKYRFTRNSEGDILDNFYKVQEFTINTHHIKAQESMTLQPYSPYHVLALHYTQAEDIPAALNSGGNVGLRSFEYNLFDLLAGKHRIWPQEGNSFSLLVNMEPYLLTRLAWEFPEFRILADLPGCTASSIINSYPFEIKLVCQQIIDRILACSYFPSAAQYYLRKNCVNLFLNYIHQLGQDKNVGLLVASADSIVLNDVLACIVKHPEQSHTPSNLSRRFRISAEKVTAYFEWLFHITRNNYILQVRMDKAFRAIMITTESLTSIAFKAEYPDYNLLNVAFEKYYKCTPMQLRNAQ